MENYSFNSSSSDSSSHSIPSLPQAQSIPFAEGQGDDWSFQDFLGILRRRSLVIVGVTIAMMTTVVINLTLNQKPPEYEGSFQLLVEPVTDDAKAVDVVKDNSSGNSGAAGLDYESQIQVLKSPALMGSIIRTLQVSYPDITYNSLINSLIITQLDGTKIIEVRYRSNDPNEVKTVLDRIAEDYIDYSQEKRQTKLRQGIRFVDKELPSIRGRVDRLQKDLQTFRQKYDFVNPEAQTDLITGQITALANQRESVTQELAQARANLAILQGKNGRLAALINAPLYQQLLAQVQQLDVQIATESIRLQDDNPTLQTLKEKRQSLTPLVSQEAQRVYDVKLAEIVNQIQTLEVGIGSKAEEADKHLLCF